MTRKHTKRHRAYKAWIGYGLLAAVVAMFLMLWAATGDLPGASLSLILFALGGALLSAVLAYLISNVQSWIRRLRGVGWEDYLGHLEARGQAVLEQYQATHALTFEDLNTSSLVHIIDVGDDTLLCLYGQQYFDFEPLDGDQDPSQLRRFPTKTFSLLRGAKRKEVLALRPGSEVIEPILCQPIVRYDELFDLGFKLEDGELLSGVSLEATKRALQAAT